MTDNELVQLFLPLITEALAAEPYNLAPYSADNLDGLAIQQNYQPTQQGVNTCPTIYFQKIHTHRYGYPGRSDKWDPLSEAMIHTESQGYESVWQFTALVTQDPTNTEQMTASDLIVYFGQAIASDAVRIALNEEGVGILRPLDIANPYFLDDRARFAASPSLDITFTYKNIVTSTSNVVESINSGIHPVL